MPTVAARSRKKAPQNKTHKVAFMPPQLATLVEESPTGANWISETKFDGYRMQAHCVFGDTIMYSRNALDWTHKFPTVAAAIGETFGDRHVVLDGEVVVGSRNGSSFHALQAALSANDTSKARYMVFDILHFDGLDLRLLPLTERRSALEQLFDDVPARGIVQISKLIRGSAASALAKACAANGEGIICKRRDAAYSSGRSQSWVKVKCGKRQELVIVGYSQPKGARTGIGALLLGVYEKGKVLRYAGRVGSGFSTDDLITLRSKLGAIETDETPLHSSVDLRTVKEAGKVTWVKPKLVAEVSFTDWTPDGALRHPVFQGLREDKKPTSIKREG
ncbi:MAG: non-homologous end-joining DNA ligase [Gemmatimonas sp.]